MVRIIYTRNRVMGLRVKVEWGRGMGLGTGPYIYCNGVCLCVSMKEIKKERKRDHKPSFYKPAALTVLSLGYNNLEKFSFSEGHLDFRKETRPE